LVCEAQKKRQRFCRTRLIFDGSTAYAENSKSGRYLLPRSIFLADRAALTV
jgi:hypothetical protein